MGDAPILAKGSGSAKTIRCAAHRGGCGERDRLYPRRHGARGGVINGDGAPPGDGVEDDIAVPAVRAHPVTGERPPELGPELLPFALG